MADFTTERLRERLEWVEHARKGILLALSESIDPTFSVIPTVDPLKFILKISTRSNLPDAAIRPMRIFLRIWAGKYNCDLPVIKRMKTEIRAEVLIKHRSWKKNAIRPKTHTTGRGPRRSG